MNRLVILIFLSFIVACSHKDEIPKGVLPPEQMKGVMWDMLQAERFSSGFLKRDSIAGRDIQKENFKLYDQVFQVHNITKDEFIKSFRFYLGRPDLSKIMFDSLSAEANRRKVEAYKRVPVE